MTDKPQELDEILNVLYMQGEDIGKLEYGSATHQITAVNGAKQALLDWHNKQVDEVLDRAKQRFHEPIEHDGSYISISVIDKTFDELIQAERNKLKEGKDE